MRLRDSRGRFKKKVLVSFLRKARLSYREWKSSESLNRRLNKVGVWLEPDEPKFLKYVYEFRTLCRKEGFVCIPIPSKGDAFYVIYPIEFLDATDKVRFGIS